MSDINQDGMRHGKRTQRSVKEDIAVPIFDITHGFSHGSIMSSLSFLDETKLFSSFAE